MTELRPWSSFEQLVDELATLQVRSRAAAARSVDEILTLRSWKLALTWPRLGIRQTASGEALGALPHLIRQTPLLSRVQEPLARAFHEVQALAQRWSVRDLKRQRDSIGPKTVCCVLSKAIKAQARPGGQL